MADKIDEEFWKRKQAECREQERQLEASASSLHTPVTMPYSQSRRSPRAASWGKAARECAIARCEEQPLAASDALVDQDFNLNPTVLGPPGLRLVRRCWSVLAHGARCDDMPCRHVGLLH